MSVYIERVECNEGHPVCRVGEGPQQRGCGCCRCCDAPPCDCTGCSLPFCRCYRPRSVSPLVETSPGNLVFADDDRLPESEEERTSYWGSPFAPPHPVLVWRWWG